MDFISLRVTFCQIYSLLETFPGFTGSDRWLTAMSAVVKMCIIVLVFPHCCLPRFHLEEMFPFAAWKQAAGQQQVSLFLVVRSLKPPLYYYYHETINPYCPDYGLSSHVQRNHGCFTVYPFIFSLFGMPLYTSACPLFIFLSVKRQLSVIFPI